MGTLLPDVRHGAQQARPHHRGERNAPGRKAGVLEEQSPGLALVEFIQRLHEEKP
jgi:hypothetical protein